MPYKVGKKTKIKGWTILKKEKGKWVVVGHSKSKKDAEGSIRARYMAEHSPEKMRNQKK